MGVGLLVVGCFCPRRPGMQMIPLEHRLELLRASAVCMALLLGEQHDCKAVEGSDFDLKLS